MKLTFEQKDFDTLRKFQNRVYKQFGENTYVGTDSLTLHVEYSPKVKATIRPLCKEWPLECEFRRLVCEDCKNGQAFLCAPDEVDYVCDECLLKRKKKGAQKDEKDKNKTV
jgi:hypothetical protein